MFSIRPATPDDIPAIAAIYNHAIRHTTATFDTEEKTLDDRARWLAAHGPRHPVIVATDSASGEVIGWASLSPFSDRPAYGDTAENSIYVHADHRGRGVGRALLAELLTLARRAGLHAIVARIAGENAASIRLHEAQGFVRAGTLREVGRKFGRLIDVHYLECLLPGEAAAEE